MSRVVVVVQAFHPIRRQRQADVCEFEVNLVYKASSRSDSKATQKIPVLGKTKTNKKNVCVRARESGVEI